MMAAREDNVSSHYHKQTDVKVKVEVKTYNNKLILNTVTGKLFFL